LSTAIEKDLVVERCKTGDATGYNILYNQYVKAMYNTCLRLMGNQLEAEDVLQESFTEAFRNIAGFEYRTSFGGWLKQICINKCINQLKKRKYKIIDLNEDLPLATETTGQDEDEVNLKVQDIKKAILCLPDGYRSVLSLYLLEGYDHDEIASILQLAPSTIRSQYLRAKNKLLQILKDRHEQN
jgi:RNA polymerase sigma-70 factor (ECF subfamily)